MHASDRVLAWRYSRALFLAAVDRGLDARVRADFSLAHGAVAELLPLIRDPKVSVTEKKKRLGVALHDKVSMLTIRFFELLIDKKRFELLPLVAVDFARLVAEKNNLAKAKVLSAAALSAEDQQKLKERLKRFAGKDIELEMKEDPEILGGLVVRMGDWVLDSSLRSQLKNMRRAINGH